MKRRTRDESSEAGFTLVELLVVLAILGLLVAVVTPQVLKYLDRAKVDAARIQMKNFDSALDLFSIDVGRYPTQQEGLEALVANPGSLPTWHGPYIKGIEVPKDPWGHAYVYRYPGQNNSGTEYDLMLENNNIASK